MPILSARKGSSNPCPTEPVRFEGQDSASSCFFFGVASQKHICRRGSSETRFLAIPLACLRLSRPQTQGILRELTRRLGSSPSPTSDKTSPRNHSAPDRRPERGFASTPQTKQT